MSQIQTVKGPVDSNVLGLSLLHEHVLWHFDDSRRKTSIEFAVKLLNDAAKVGVQTLVDLTPHRRIDWYTEIAAQTPVNIIACTGYYHQLGLLSQPLAKPLENFIESQMVERMVNELSIGIDNTHVRAGIIKVAAVKHELNAWEVQVFTAAAKAHLKTGACIATHAVAGARQQAEVLQRAGANLNQVFFSHIDTEGGWEGRSAREQAKYLAEIARQGGWLLLNNFGCEFWTTSANEAYLLRYLCDAGVQDRVLVSIDFFWTWNKDGEIEFEEEVNYPGAVKRSYAFMMTYTVPELLKAGFTDHDIQAFLVDNPRKFFSKSGKG